MLNFKNIDKSYNNGGVENIVLDDINISLRKEDITLIIGKSGVGKSTLLNIIGCLLRPSRGYIDTENSMIDLSTDDTEKFRIENFSYVFQNYNLLPEFTIHENLLIPSYINKLDVRKTEKRISNLLDYMKLTHLKNTYPNLISQGEKQRIAILRALLGKQKIILADEPTGNLDEINTKIILDLIVKINKDLNYTFIIASHDNNFIKISNNIYTIENKKLKKNE